MTRSPLERKVSIPLGKGESSGILHLPAGRSPRGGLVVAHGAGNDMNFPLLPLLAGEAARAGWAALRFNFLYRERGRKSPDRQEVLEESWKSALAVMEAVIGSAEKPLVGAGKSLGGRVMSQVAARGDLPLKGLVFLGYPLHAPGKRDQPRDAHLYGIDVPMLFFAGTRDSLCDLPALQGVIGRMNGDVELEVVEGGDHSFHVPKSAGLTREEIDAGVTVKTLDWLEKRFR